MRVTVRLHASLRRYMPAGSNGIAAVVELPADGTVADVISRLGIPAGHTKMMVSGDEQLDLATVLRDGQELNLFPPLAGGS